MVNGSSESMILVCRLLSMVKGFSLESDEKNAIELDKGHVFYHDIQHKKTVNPIVFKGFQSINPNLKSALEKLEAVILCENNKDIHCNLLHISNELEQYMKLARMISGQILDAVLKASEFLGIEEEVDWIFQHSEVQKKILKIRQGSKSNQEGNLFYTHFTSDVRGGGNWKNIYDRLKLAGTENIQLLQLIKNKGISFDLESYAKSFVYDIMNLDFKCAEAWIAAELLALHADEVADIYDEINSWRVLPCSMALHSRLGCNSWMQRVGIDVMRMIINFL